MQLQVQKEQKSPTECELKVEVAAEVMLERIETAIDILASKIELPGFRAGRVPRRVVAERFGAAVRQEAVQEVLKEAYAGALTETKLDPLTPGIMSDVEYRQGDPLTFTVKVEVAPEFELPSLSDITVELAQPCVEEEDVLESLDALRENHAALIPTEEPVSRDCVINVDLQELDASGLPIVGHSRKNLQIDLTHPALGEDFAAKVMGLRAGETALVELPVRSSGQEPKDTRFQVTVQGVKRKELPALDDEFARAVNPRMQTLDELRIDLKEFLQLQAAYKAHERMHQAAVEAILKKVDFPVPARMLDDYLDHLVEDAYKERQGEPSPADVERFKNQYRASGIRNLRWYFVRRKLIAERGLEVADRELEAEIERLARADGTPAEQFKKQLSAEQRDRVREDLIERKVLMTLEAEIQTIPRPMSLAEFEGRTPGRIVSA